MSGLDHVPDVRDGLTQVERRVLQHLAPPDASYGHSNRVMDAARREAAREGREYRQRDLYDVLVQLARPFVLRYPLVDGEGNFGSIDSDPAAYPQYTEARRSPAGQQVVGVLAAETTGEFDATVPFRGTFPALLANGAADGLSSFPPHRLAELAAAIALRIERPAATLDDVLAVLPGPDYPMAGEVVDRGQVRAAYATGKGEIEVRSTFEIERQRGRTQLVFLDLPPGVFKGGDDGVIRQTADLVRDTGEESRTRGAWGSGIGVADLQDYSDRRGMRLIVELMADRDPGRVADALFEGTALQTAVPVLMVALVDGKPEQLTLLELIDHYVDHQRSVRSGARDEIDAAIVRDLAALAAAYGGPRRTRLPA